MGSGVAGKVKQFYERYPYPCQMIRSERDLKKSGHERVLKTILSTVGMSIDDLGGKRVLDAGCGTGEKAAYCAFHGAIVDAFDISETSVRIGMESAGKLGVKVNYMVGSFERIKLDCEYDLILCIGSLHHTENPKGNFLRMAKCLKKGGRIALGLYNLYGRLWNRVQRKFLWLGENDPAKVAEKAGAHMEKSPVRVSSVADRYASPHETYHTIEEVAGWFKEAGIVQISTSPSVNLDSSFGIKASQLGWMLKGKGFFFIGGKRKLKES